MDFEEIPYQTWGPWKNQWGYVTAVAQFSDEDLIVKSITPCKKKLIKRFTHWEDCAQFIELIEQDRRF